MSAADSRQPFRRRRWRRRLVVAMLVFLAGMGGVAGYDRYVQWQYEQEYNTLIAELDAADPGWRLADILAGRKVIPANENGAMIVKKAARLLPTPWPSGKFSAPIEFETQIRNVPPPYLLTKEQAQAIRNELDAAKPASNVARSMVNYPEGRFDVIYKPDVVSTNLSFLDFPRTTTQILNWDTHLLCQEHKTEAAWRNCFAIINTGNAIGDEPSSYAQLLGLTCRWNAVTCMERILAQGIVSEHSLHKAQKRLTKELDFNWQLTSLRGERAQNHQLLRALETGKLTYLKFQKLVYGKYAATDLFNRAANQMDGARVIKFEHNRMLKAHTKEIALGKFSESEQIQKIGSFEFGLNMCGSHFPSKQVITMLSSLTPKFGRITYTAIREKTILRCAVAGIAAERYRLIRGGFPDSLAELEQKGFIIAVPVDPFSEGKPLSFRKTKNGVVVYSVYAPSSELPRYDGQALDDPDFQNPYRLEFRVWNSDQRRRLARPPKKQ